METSQRYIINIPIEARAERLAKDYTGYGNEIILDSLEIIKKRLSERFPKIVEGGREAGRYLLSGDVNFTSVTMGDLSDWAVAGRVKPLANSYNFV